MTRSGANLCSRRGSVFIETMVAMVIVGVAIAALMEFMGGSTKAHGSIQTTLQASDYASAALEYAANRTFAQLQALETAPQGFSPPINGQGVAYPATSSAGWKQILSAKSVSENSLRTAATAGSSKALWVTASIERNGKLVYTQSRLFMGDL